MDRFIALCRKLEDNLKEYFSAQLELAQMFKRKSPEQVFRSSTFFEIDVQAMSDDTFRKTFNITKKTYEYFCTHLAASFNEREGSNIVPPRKKILMSVLVLNSCAEIKIIAALFGVGITTVTNTFHLFCKLMKDYLKPLHIKAPESLEDFKTLSRQFEEKTNLINVVGAVDGTHVPIECPLLHHIDYFNYKCFYSISCIAVCDANCKFWFV